MLSKTTPKSAGRPLFNDCLFFLKDINHVEELSPFWLSRLKQAAILDGKSMKQAAKEISHHLPHSSRHQILEILETTNAYEEPPAEEAA
jgi:hypothetical protein